MASREITEKLDQKYVIQTTEEATLGRPATERLRLLKIPDVEKVSSPADKKTANETEAAANKTEQKFRQEEYADMFEGLHSRENAHRI